MPLVRAPTGGPVTPSRRRTARGYRRLSFSSPSCARREFETELCRAAALIRLIEERSASMPIVFLSAGPGWGKTTLLGEWASRSRRPFAWVSVDENDNDPIVLLTYIATAIDRITPLDSGRVRCAGITGCLGRGNGRPASGGGSGTIEPAVVLVLDDLHLLDDPQGLDAIATLSRHIPEGSQLALSARGDPALPLAALRAGGLAIEIGPDDLRMDAGGGPPAPRARPGVDLRG